MITILSASWMTTLNQVKKRRETIDVKNRKGEEIGVHLPKVASYYRTVYGWVDRCNQQLAYHNSDCRSVRKQSRILDPLQEMYAPTNGHTIFRNSNLREDMISSAEFRFEVIRVWYALFKMYNAKQEIMHYPSRQPRTRRNVKSVTLSPRKGKNFVQTYYADFLNGDKVSICNQRLVSHVQCGSPPARIYIFLADH